MQDITGTPALSLHEGFDLIYALKVTPHLNIDNGLSQTGRETTPEATTGIQVRSEGGWDPNVRSGGLRKGPILDMPYLMESKMRVGGIQS